MVLKHKEGRRIKCIIFCPTAKIEDLVFSAHNFPHCIYQQSHHHHHTSNHKTSLSFFPQPIKRPETSQKIFHVNHPSFLVLPLSAYQAATLLNNTIHTVSEIKFCVIFHERQPVHELIDGWNTKPCILIGSQQQWCGENVFQTDDENIPKIRTWSHF